MKKEEMLNEIINRTTQAILEKVVDDIADTVYGEVSDLVHAMALAAAEVLDKPCSEACGRKHKRAASRDKQEEPVSFEVHARGIKLDAEARLRFSKMVCDFLKSLENEDESEGGDEGEEDESEEPVGEQRVVGGVERITVAVDDDGKTVIKRRVIKPSGETAEGDSDED